MKMKSLKIGRFFAVAFFLIVLAFGVAFTPKTQSASAEGTTYTESALDYFTESNGVTAKYYLNKASNNNTAWPGVRVEMSVEEGVYDATLTYNGVLNPLGRFPFASDSITDAEGKKKVIADAKIVSYTSVKDPSKQFSVIAFNRDREGICWYVMALTGVENLEYREGHVFYVGTEQRAIGRRDNMQYDKNGYTNWSRRDVGWGDLFGCGATFSINEQTGGVYFNDYICMGEMASEGFIDATKEGLIGTKYESACSIEYVKEMLTEMKTTGAFMSITYLGIQEREIGFNYIGFYGQDVGSGNKEINVSPYLHDVNTTVYLEEVPTLRMSDIFPRETIQSVYPETPYVCGFFGTDTWSGNSNWWDTRSSTNQNDPLSMYVNAVGKYTLIAQVYSGHGSNGTPASFYHVYTLNVVEGDPKVKGVENPYLFKGATHDLRAYFDVWHLGSVSETEFSYQVDGTTVQNGYVADGNAHRLGITVTDKYDNTVSFEYEVQGAEISVPETVNLTGFYTRPVVLPVPHLPNGLVYSVLVKTAEGEFVTDSVAHIFEAGGNFVAVYTVETPFVEGGKIEYECAITLALATEKPTIRVEGDYEEEYFEGKTISVLPATATNGVSGYDVTVAVYKNGTAQTVENGEITLSSGAWKVVYTADGVSVERAFTVVEDTEKPSLLVGGTYATSYEQGRTITVWDAVANDNSGEEISYEVKVYLGKNEVSVKNGEFVIEQGGEYKIVYTATDGAGNVAEQTFVFSVAGSSGGCGSTAFGVTGALVLVLFGVMMIRRKKYENE